MKLCVIANLFGGQETPFLERKFFHRRKSRNKISPSSQFMKIQHDPVMQMATQFRLMPELFGNRETLFLEKRFFHRWLNSIQTARVKDETVRSKLVKSQFECVQAIDDYFSNRLKDYITVNWYTSYQTVNT
jgi:hypothetical protein